MAGQTVAMEYIYTDASFSHRTRIGGAAVVVPEWCEHHKGKWFSRLNVKIVHDKDKIIFCAACKCSDSHDAEKRALGIAFLAAHDMLKAKNGIKIEIITDSLSAINDIITGTKEDLITSAISNLRKKENIIVSKTKAHNGHAGNELADKWAKRTRRKFEEEHNMRMPFRNNNSYGNDSRRSNSRPNPFDGSTEMDIRTLTERVLNDENNIGFVTPEGKVMPRNMAFGSGNRNGIELVKQRIWGSGEDFIAGGDNENADGEYYPVNIVYSDEALQMIAAESSKSPERETGGALIGSWQRDPDGYITVNVERATGPGVEAVRNHALFSPHMDYYRSRIAYYRETHNWDYLGEWHKHPGNFDSLSSTDIETAHALIDDEGWPLLLLPIVNEINGRFVMENNLILSPQLGNEIMTHINSVDLEEINDEAEITAYIDSEKVNNFRAGNEDTEIIDGIYNPGESFVFMDIPGIKNAAAKLIKDNGKNLPVSGLERVLTVLVSDENIRCYFSDEGEIKTAGHVIIDKESTIYERNAGLTETTILRSKTVTLDFVLGLFRNGETTSTPYTPENYIPRRHIFTVETSEGEVCRIDTSDRSSVFYGSSWEKILTASENGDFIRGRAMTRCVSRDNRFSGYTVNVEGIEAFLPASKASWFYDPEHDASGKYIALSIENVYTSGAKAGKLVVNAYKPVRFLFSRQGRKNYQPGGTAYAIAMDYDRSYLIFPYQKDQYIYVPIYEAVSFASNMGLENNPEMFTGLCWNLRITNRKDNQCLASPVDILMD